MGWHCVVGINFRRTPDPTSPFTTETVIVTLAVALSWDSEIERVHSAIATELRFWWREAQFLQICSGFKQEVESGEMLRLLPWLFMWWNLGCVVAPSMMAIVAQASPLVALQTSFAMNADVPAKSDSCHMEDQEKYRAAIGLRTRHLQSEAARHEQRLADLHLQLTGEDRCCTPIHRNMLAMKEWMGSSNDGFDEIEAALNRRQGEIDRLLRATDAAIARTLAQLVPN
eukprot:Skav202893  [mRNA]  locus=scaffold131:11529:13844:- [translate_table: standard]